MYWRYVSPAVLDRDTAEQWLAATSDLLAERLDATSAAQRIHVPASGDETTTTGKSVDRLIDVVTYQSTRPKTDPSRPTAGDYDPDKEIWRGEVCQPIYDTVTDLA